MKKILAFGSIAALAVSIHTTHASAFDPEEAFLQCMSDCQQWGNPQTVAQCEAWCYSFYDPQ